MQEFKQNEHQSPSRENITLKGNIILGKPKENALKHTPKPKYKGLAKGRHHFEENLVVEFVKF